MERMVPRPFGINYLLDLLAKPLLLLTLVFVDLQGNGGTPCHLLEVLEWHLMNLHRPMRTWTALRPLPGSHLK